MAHKIFLTFVLSVLSCSIACAQDWATKMFESTTHDFGTVARDAKTEYEFVFKNPYVEEVHIASVGASCGCTTPIIKNDKDTLKTYQKSAIIAHFNTDRFQGSRSATLTVSIDRPYFAQVQLHVSGVIRTDVIVNPGGIDFGSVEQGTPGVKAIAVRYAGWYPWKITDIQSASPYLSARLAEVGRDNGMVDYHVFVTLNPKAHSRFLERSPDPGHERSQRAPGPHTGVRLRAGRNRCSQLALHGRRGAWQASHQTSSGPGEQTFPHRLGHLRWQGIPVRHVGRNRAKESPRHPSDVHGRRATRKDYQDDSH